MLNMTFQDEESKVSEIIYKIQVYVYPRRIRLKEFFLDFDNLRQGRTTRLQYSRALNMAGLKLTEDEVETLIEYFTEVGPNVQKPQNINYDKFCKEVDQIFASDEAEMAPPDAMNMMETASPNATLRQSVSSFAPREVEDEDQVQHIMHRLAMLCKNRGLILKYCFQDFERGPSPSPSNVNPRRGGKVTISQFKRLFPFKKEIPEDDLEMLIQRYTTEKGDVHFQAMHNDVSEVLDPKAPPFPTSPLYLRPDGTSWDHHSLDPIKKIQSKVVEKRVRLYEHFQDFDALRKGFCTPGQLKAVLTIMNLDKEVNKDDFAHLVQCYTRDDGMFCYAAFCKDVDQAFTTPGLERDPMATISLPDATTTAPARRNRITMTPARKDRLDALEDKIRARVRTRRILMTPTFKDMDRTHTGHVTRGQFNRVMGMLGFECSPEEIALLAGVYCDLGNHNDFNYVDFIKSCDPPVEYEEIAMQQINAPYQDMAPSKYFDPETGGRKVRPLDRQSPTMY